MILTSQILLWIAVAMLAMLVIALARQIGVLHERIAPAGALTLHQHVKVGDRPTRLELRDTAGNTIQVGGPRERMSQLLFFAGTDCPICKSLLPVLRSSVTAEKDWLEVVIAGDGDTAAYTKLMNDHGLADTPLVLSEALGRSFGVSKLPYAVLLDHEGRVASMGLVNSREHLESLFKAKELGVASMQEFLTRRKRNA